MCSPNDNKVLNFIFNPIISETYDEDFSEQTKISEDIYSYPKEIEEQSKKLEIEGIEETNNGNIDAAITAFNNAIKITPNRSSGYNNRAQVLRLKNNTKDALQDLNTAIRLCNGNGLVGCQAFCQRGLIYLNDGRQEEGKQDLERSAKLGNSFAKSLLVQLNPYSALCNKMLTEMIAKARQMDRSDD